MNTLTRLSCGIAAAIWLSSAAMADTQINAPQIRSVQISGQGDLQIRLQPGLRGYGDRLRHPVLEIVGRNADGEPVVHETVRLRRGQSYASLRGVAAGHGDGLIWSIGYQR